MAATKVWTLEELDLLPDDSNRYELVDGELFVTPAPSVDHETIAARLTRVLDPYVAEHRLGYVFRPRAIVEHGGSRVEPDLAVRQAPAGTLGWDAAPLPILVVEILSPSNRPHERAKKREFYSRARIADYWIVDPERKTIASARRGLEDVVSGETLSWHPTGVAVPLVIDVVRLFARE